MRGHLHRDAEKDVLLRLRRSPVVAIAGRVTFLERTPFLLPELAGAGIDEALETTWLRGGFPRSVLAAKDEESFAWRDDFVRTFHERDVRDLRARVDVPRLGRLLGHPVRGASWESLVLEKGKRRIAVDCKASSAPTVTRGFWSALDDLRIDEAWVVAPIASAFPLGSGVEAVPLGDFLARAAPRR